MPLLGSSPALSGIKCLIRDFYINPDIELVEHKPGKEWKIKKKCGKVLEFVRVVKKGKRYRFELNH